ncbi:hypothetical protein ELR57_07490 [Cohnella sp. AR92]|nr:hypothetical protein ELR57_07490 [Cohnella sp. AR92]
MRLFWLLTGLALLLLLAACGGKGGESGASELGGNAHLHESGDLQEETASLTDMPSFLQGQSELVGLAYTAAAKLKDTLQYIPCYCGCGESAGHTSNLDCFIAGVREDGTVIWDDHGTRCGVCQHIAIQSAQLKQQGKTDLEIRQFIDQNYSEGYAASTDTSMPQA